jgi:hypothetical protein
MARLTTSEHKRTGLFVALLAYALILPRFKDYNYILLLVPVYDLVMRHLHLPHPRTFLATGVLLTLPMYEWNYFSLIVAACVFGLVVRRDREIGVFKHMFPRFHRNRVRSAQR